MENWSAWDSRCWPSGGPDGRIDLGMQSKRDLTGKRIAVTGGSMGIGLASAEACLEAIRINLFGTFLVARQACRLMKTRGGGRLVLFSGGGAATPFPHYTAYACGKAAVVRLTETLAQEMQPFNIQVNCVAPGFVVTRLHQETLVAGDRAGAAFLEQTKRQIESGGVPATVGAGAAAFLLSDAAR